MTGDAITPARDIGSDGKLSTLETIYGLFLTIAAAIAGAVAVSIATRNADSK
jgi:hypothetical protein